MTTSVSAAPALSGPDLRALFATAAAWLETNAAAINAINVFPVPDGDTGTNMSLTLRAAVEETRRAGDSVGEVVTALSHGALMGARGNSGVILSQYLRGLAESLADRSRVDGGALAVALGRAASTARAAVARPVEGTILTVAADVARAVEVVGHVQVTLADVLVVAVREARASVERTPDLLPVLREADVVDSGALGLAIALEGALKYVRGEPLPEAPISAGRIADTWLERLADAHGDGGERFGYCVEFVLRAPGLEGEDLRGDLQELGDSLLIVGEPGLLHVHVHTDDPGAALSRGVARGTLTRVKVDNMEEQALGRAGRSDGEASARATPSAPASRSDAALGPFSVVAVAIGEGLVETLRGAGAEQVVTGGQTMNPSTRELLAAIDAAVGSRVVVLPNNKNIIWTAEQAARLSSKSVDVVPSRTIPQGIAALLALNPDSDADEALAAMRAAIGQVRTVEVTRAARPTRIGDTAVAMDQPIALVDDELVTAAATPEEAAISAIAGFDPGDAPLLTVYHGEAVPADAAERFAVLLHTRFPAAEIETHAGGQPFYDYIISVE